MTRQRKPPIDPWEICDIPTLSERSGMSIDAIKAVRRRSKRGMTRAVPFPEPDGEVSTGPWWFWSATLLPWLLETGRLKGSPDAQN